MARKAKVAKDPKAVGAARRARFVKLASKRTQMVLSKIRVLGNCSNRASYLFYAADITKIFGAIEDALTEARARFDAAPKDKEEAKQFTIE